MRVWKSIGKEKNVCKKVSINFRLNFTGTLLTLKITKYFVIYLLLLIVIFDSKQNKKLPKNKLIMIATKFKAPDTFKKFAVNKFSLLKIKESSLIFH